MLSIQEYLEKHFFPGYKIAAVIEDSNTPHIVLEPKSSGVCQACGSSQTNIHDYYQRYILDLPILGKNVIIDVKVRRVICKCCNHKGVEFISWLAKTKYDHCTERKVKEIVKDCHKDLSKMYYGCSFRMRSVNPTGIVDFMTMHVEGEIVSISRIT